MVSSFAVDVPVARGNQNHQLIIGCLDSGGRGDGPAMQAVKDIAVKIMRKLGRLADAGDQDQIMRVKIKLNQGVFKSLQDGKIPAARAPGSIKFSEAVQVKHLV